MAETQVTNHNVGSYIKAVKDEAIKRGLIKKIVITDENNKTKLIPLPDYGEVKITCHDRKVKLIETTIKEQM